MLILDSVHTFYGHIHALKGISLTVNEGEVVSLIGSNGAGKTTTLNTISGVLSARAGAIYFQEPTVQCQVMHHTVPNPVSGWTVASARRRQAGGLAVA